ncbi:hypothetical protein LSTR_LSTR004639 [Laodelphax striatellus]|uniref:Uncharacterized protein n=1 Tax=Laodelphax striatellus TaxID=195883 RepID=A0A482WUW6_LAOST|nr:hypothetical protein LSTR_LSTR004639 [Laodelphax striatellus]
MSDMEVEVVGKQTRKRKKGVLNMASYKRNIIKTAKVRGDEHVNWAGRTTKAKQPGSTNCGNGVQIRASTGKSGVIESQKNSRRPPNPATPLRYRERFINHNSIPGAVYQNSVLQNPDEIIPDTIFRLPQTSLRCHLFSANYNAKCRS